LEKESIPFILPGLESQQIIMDAIMRVKAGSEKKEVARILYKEAKKLIKQGAKAFILGCTEIPLVFPFEKIREPVFDATTILANAAIQFAKCKA